MSHFESLVLSDELNGRNSAAIPPPSYAESGKAPFLLKEMTTRTEVVTTTTTETTHFFSPSHWRKQIGHRPPNSHQDASENMSSRNLRQLSNQHPHSILFDKALPPTPPQDIQDPMESASNSLDHSAISSSPSSPVHSESSFYRSRKKSTGGELQTTAALAHAALGLGLPHASASLSRETNAITFMTSDSLVSSRIASPSGLRRAKSTQRLQPRHTSDNHAHTANGEQLTERRKRGLSFTATSFLNLMNSDTKGKGKEVQPPSPSIKPPPLPLSRKSSFWNKKKPTQPNGPTSSTPHDDAPLPLLTIPPIHQFSSFEMSDFPTSQSSRANMASYTAPDMSRSHSENVALSRSPISSPRIPTGSISFSATTQPRSSTNERTSDVTGDTFATPRLRTQTSTPLLHRLSMGVFSVGESSPVLGTRSHNTPPSISSQNLVPPKSDLPVPKPLGAQESPEMYLNRLKSAVDKADVAGILASSPDPFYSQTLRLYINQFDFQDIPLDVALRRLLMEVGLPRETQQIDRVMEAFASRYMGCNADIFVSEDHPYILAFSLIMLHTDAFNPSNKRKMTKADYIKNTKLPGIPTEVLDYFFDNIVFAPFIFIEDPVEPHGQHGPSDSTSTVAINTPTSAMPSSKAPVSFKIGNKVDPYYLITNNLLDPLRIDINSSVPLENPFSYEGTDGPWDEEELHQAFVKASAIHIKVPAAQRTLPIFGGGANEQPQLDDFVESANISHPKLETWSLKFTKIGLLNRKDDILEGGRKSSNRKWKTWSVILTGSHLLFFRDPTRATSLSQPPEASVDDQENNATATSDLFRPDESFSLQDAIAVFDRSYTKYKHTMRFVLPDGRQILFQAANDVDLNAWISRINYASAFKSAGIRMRPPGLSSEDVLLTGVAAATSHLHDLQHRSELRRHRSWDSNVAHELMDMLSVPNSSKPLLRRRVTMSGRAEFDADIPIAPEIDGAEQFKATFDQVKADLAASSWSSLDDDPWLSHEEDGDVDIYDSPPTSSGSSASHASRLLSRSQIIQSRIRDINSKLHASQAEYDLDMKFIRNIAILTPFQKSTRSRLSAAIQGVAKRVTLIRLEREKLQCHRHVLACDLASEGRSWSQSKQIALRAAKQTLQSRRPQPVPAMTLNDSTEYFSRFPDRPLSQRPDSSTTCESFYSAADFGMDSTPVEQTSFKVESPRKARPSVSASVPLWNQSQEVIRSSISSSLSSTSPRPSSNVEDVRNHDNDPIGQHEDEEAEEWNRTRCAQRVSLIHVPSSIMISTRMRNSDNATLNNS